MLNADPNLTNAMNKLPFDEAVLFNHKEAAVKQYCCWLKVWDFLRNLFLLQESLAKVTKEDMSLYEGMEDYADGD